MSSANVLSGGIYTFKSNVTAYFDLKDQNKILVEENMRLRKQMEGIKKLTMRPTLDSGVLPSKYKFIAAEVINNNYSKTKNTLTLNKGSRDSVKIDMGVITSKGVVGIVNNLSKKYASVQSI